MHLRGCETCRAEAQVLAAAAERLCRNETKPAYGLRDKVLAIATARSVPSYAQPYAATVAALDALLREVDTHQWTGVIAYEKALRGFLLKHKSNETIKAHTIDDTNPVGPLQDTCRNFCIV